MGHTSSHAATAGLSGTPTRHPRSRRGGHRLQHFPPETPAARQRHDPRPSRTWISSMCLTRGWLGRSYTGAGDPLPAPSSPPTAASPGRCSFPSKQLDCPTEQQPNQVRAN